MYVISFNTICSSYVLLSTLKKKKSGNLRPKRWITCSESCNQVSGRTGLKSKTIYCKVHFPDQSIRKNWVCFNSGVLPKLSTSSRKLFRSWLNPSSQVALDFGRQPFYCWTSNIARKLLFNVLPSTVWGLISDFCPVVQYKFLWIYRSLMLELEGVLMIFCFYLLQMGKLECKERGPACSAYHLWVTWYLILFSGWPSSFWFL